MTALLALSSALLVGASDFLGGVASRRASALRVAALAQLVSLLFSIPAAAVASWDRITGGDILWSVASGIVAASGLVLFYTAMGRGLLSVVAPTAAVTGASVPVVYAFARGERPGAAAISGIVRALPAIAIGSIAPGSPGAAMGGLRALVALSVGAGVLFGLFFVFLSRTSADAGLWPVTLSRVASATPLVVAALVVGGGPPVRSLARFVIPTGALEMLATVTLLLALQRGPIAVAVVLASLYPVPTVVLAAGVLRERLSRLQLSGVVLALIAAVLVSIP